jgi:ribonuclease BN (tRNA processing enzyme)
LVQLAQEAQVQQLFLFHHDPAATDEALNERQFLAQQIFPHTFVAREGLKIPLPSSWSGA